MRDALEGKVSSVHLIFNKIHFNNIKSMSDFFETHKDIINNGVEDYIDQGVYTPSRFFRLPECTKKGKERFLETISENHDFQDALLTTISNDSILIPTTKKDLEHKPTAVVAPTTESISEMESVFLANLDKFHDDANAEYNVWLSVGIRMRRTGFSLSTFIAFSKLDTKRFDEESCTKKWETFAKYEPDCSPMNFYMRKKRPFKTRY